MTVQDILAYLKSNGSDDLKKQYELIVEEVFGVSNDALNELKQTILNQPEIDIHMLVMELWDEPYYEMRYLSIILLEPEDVTHEVIDYWTGQIHHMYYCEFISHAVFNSPFAHKKIIEWINSDALYKRRMAYQIVQLQASSKGDFENVYFEFLLDLIKSDIHRVSDDAKEAMLKALYCIAMRNQALYNLAHKVSMEVGSVKIELNGSSSIHIVKKELETTAANHA